jgi:hypothetical protein
MGIGNISQNTIKQNIDNAKKFMSQQDVNECKIGLNGADANGDGKASGVEMYKSWSETCKDVFAGNDAFLKRGEEIAIAQGEIYSMYAGEDGVLDEYEYNAALQSEEMGVLVDEYWDMKNEMEAMNGEKEINGLDSYDIFFGNNDGKVSSSEIANQKSELYAKKFEDSKLINKFTQKVIEQQEEILKKFEGDDGHLSTEEFTEAVQSYEYQETLNKMNALDNIFKWFD